MPKTIPITCDPDSTLRRVPVEDLRLFQGQLKSLDRVAYDKLKSAIETHGFMVPVFTWTDPNDASGRAWILDGHQRVLVCRQEQWSIEGGVPVVDIDADSAEDAAQKLLLVASTYGKIDPQGLYEFTELHGVQLDRFQLTDLPNMNIDAFLAEFYDGYEPEPEPEPSIDEPSQTVCPRCGHAWTKESNPRADVQY